MEFTPSIECEFEGIEGGVVREQRPDVRELPSYREVRDAVWDCLPEWKRFTIAIDGRDGAGKSSLARYLAWQLGMSAFELDTFRDLTGTPFDFRLDDLRRALAYRHERNCPLVVEGITVLSVLARLGVTVDYLVFVDHVDELLPPVDDVLQVYFQKFTPLERADFKLSW